MCVRVCVRAFSFFRLLVNFVWLVVGVVCRCVCFGACVPCMCRNGVSSVFPPHLVYRQLLVLVSVYSRSMKISKNRGLCSQVWRKMGRIWQASLGAILWQVHHITDIN